MQRKRGDRKWSSSRAQIVGVLVMFGLSLLGSVVIVHRSSVAQQSPAQPQHNREAGANHDGRSSSSSSSSSEESGEEGSVGGANDRAPTQIGRRKRFVFEEAEGMDALERQLQLSQRARRNHSSAERSNEMVGETELEWNASISSHSLLAWKRWSCKNGRSIPPRPAPSQSEAIDSIVWVTFDLLPAAAPVASSAHELDGNHSGSNSDAPGNADEFWRKRWRDICQTLVPQAGKHASKAKIARAARTFAREQMFSAMITRPSGAFLASVPPGDAQIAALPYFSFFERRNATFCFTRSAGACANGNRRQGEAATSGSAPVQHGLFDVVYTHVEHDSKSQQRFRRAFPGLFHYAKQRFRSFQELKYSMRSVYYYGGLNTTSGTATSRSSDTPPAFSPASRDRCAVLPLVRRIIIVLANVDQAPDWLRVDHPTVVLITHKDLLQATDGDDDPAEVLPMFNSHAIETLLHRIPGLTRFFLYFNDDMLWGRRVSVFDYLRPLSQMRQRLRHRAAMQANLCRPSDEDSDDVTFVEGLVSVDDETRGPSSPRVTIAMEIVHYFESRNADGSKDPIWVNRFAAASNDSVIQGCSLGSAATSEIQRDGDGERPVNIAALFEAHFRRPAVHRRALRVEQFRLLVSNNRRMLLDVLGIGGWRSHNFAHYPRLLDRNVMQRMADVDFAIATRATRLQRIRRATSFWLTDACAYYHLVHRKLVDERLSLAHVDALESVGKALVPRNKDETGAAKAYFRWPPLPPDSVGLGHLQLKDAVAEYWWDNKDNGPLLPVYQFSYDILSSPAVDGDGGRQEAGGLSKSLCRLLWRRPDGSEGQAQGRQAGLLLSTSPRSPYARNTSAVFSDCKNARQSLQQRSRKHKHSDIGPEDVGPIGDEERWDHHAATLDRRDGLYHFCMMQSDRSVRRYIRELSLERKLFVTLNDDFGSSPSRSTLSSVQALLRIASGDLPSAPWDIRA